MGNVMPVNPKDQNSSKTESLSPSLKHEFEIKFGQDLSDVRVHQNSRQATLLGAKAFTHDNVIHFAPGEYLPHTPSGNKIIGHELTHIVQQRESADKTDKAKGIVETGAPSSQNLAE